MTSRSLLAPARLARQPILGTQSDERLADLARAGSEPAFEAIVARYRQPLLGYCSGLLSGDRAEDAVQQTFVNAHAALSRGEVVLRLRPWLYRIAHNTSLNALRDRALHHAPLPEEIEGVARQEHAVERRHELAEVLAGVRALPSRQREAILLRELEGRGYQEISERLGVSRAAVRQLLNRARTALRAGAGALSPLGPLLRLTEAPVTSRVAELCSAAGAVGAAKVCATVLVTGAAAGGLGAAPPDRGPEHAQGRPPPAVSASAGQISARPAARAMAKTTRLSRPMSGAAPASPSRRSTRPGRPSARGQFGTAPTRPTRSPASGQLRPRRGDLRPPTQHVQLADRRSRSPSPSPRDPGQPRMRQRSGSPGGQLRPLLGDTPQQPVSIGPTFVQLPR